tara:strand:- start:90 stop:719 length:630 start_codon:yes stop_codon:yes gene_type:complete
MLLILFVLARLKIKNISNLLIKFESDKQKLKTEKSNILRAKTNLEKKIKIFKDDSEANDQLLNESGEAIADFLSDNRILERNLESAINKIEVLEDRNKLLQLRYLKIISLIAPNLEFVNDSEKRINEILNEQSIPIMSSLINVLLDISRKNIISGKKINKVMTAKSWTEIRVSREERIYYKKISDTKSAVIFSQKKNQKSDILYMQKFN